MDGEPGQSSRSARRGMIAGALAVFVVGCAMGAASLGGGFLSGDDVHLVLNHVLVNHPSVAHAIKLVGMIHRDLYQPVPMLSFSLDFVTIKTLGLTASASGPNAGAWVFHLTNVLIHALNGVLVYWLFVRLHRHRSVGVGLVAATLFALHPYGAEVVAWLNGRMMLLATLFSLASLIASDAYQTRGRWWWAVLTLLLVALAMTSKVRVGLPVLMLILPLARRQWPGRRWWALWAAAGVLTLGFTVLGVVTTSASEMFEGAAEKLQGSSIARTVLVLAWYARHYVVPTGMSPWHPPEVLVQWSHAGIPVAIGLLVLITAAVVWSWKYTRIGALGVLWFLATVASTLPLMPSRDVMAADRYVYLPNIGLHWLTASLLVYAVLWVRRRLDTRMVVPVACALGVGGAAALLPYTWHVESYYLSNLSKASRIAGIYPNEPGVWEDVGWAHYRAGRYAEAIEGAGNELERHPVSQACEALQLVGMAEYRMGKVKEGIATLYKAVEADPDYGKCYSRLGHIYYELGRYVEAEENYVRAIEIMPQYLPAIQALAHLYRKTDRPEEAAKWYERGLEQNSFDPVSTMALAEMEMARGETDSAIDRFERLLDWQPENTVARTNLGVCYVRSGRTAEAMDAYQAVLDREPGAVMAALNLAGLKAEMGDNVGAAALVEQARSQAPTDRNILVAGHDLLVGMGRLREAAELWTRALRVEPEAPDLAAWYAWTSAMASQWQPAQEGAANALRRDSTQTMAWAALVVVALAHDDPDQASRHLERMLGGPANPADGRGRLLTFISGLGEKEPGNCWYYYVAGRLLAAEGQWKAARMAFKEFLSRCPDQAEKQRIDKLLAPASQSPVRADPV